MLLAFVVFAVFTAVFLLLRKPSRITWIELAVLACAFSLLLAFVSVSTVWVPHPNSDQLFYVQNTLGEYEGDFPLSKLSYPFYLNVYHTPFEQVTFTGNLAYGKAFLSVFFDGTRILGVNGTYSYFYPVMGGVPLYYSLNFVFSDSDSFYYFLLVSFTFVNAVGAFIGIIVGKVLAGRVHGSSKQLASVGQVKSHGS